MLLLPQPEWKDALSEKVGIMRLHNPSTLGSFPRGEPKEVLATP